MRTHALPHPALTSERGSARRPLSDTLRFGFEHYLLLPVGGLIALAWANAAPESYFTLAQRLAFAVNEIGMALFFALVTQEVVEEMVPGGALHTWRRWVMPLLAAAGGAAGAGFVYLAYVGFKHEAILQQGWLAACAFDIAFAYAIVKSIFKRHPAVAFLLVMAIATNAVGLVLIGLHYQSVAIRPGGTVLMIAAIAIAAALRYWKIRNFWAYLLLSGPLSWWAFYLDGFHPGLSLIPIVAFLPHQPRTIATFEDVPDAAGDSPRHFEHEWNFFVQAVVFLFGFVNAGVLLNAYGTGTWALVTAALVGRPLGIMTAVVLAAAAGLQLPARLGWRELLVVAIASGSGFAFALFAAVAIYPIGPVLAELKLGAVLSGAGVLAAVAAARLLQVGRFTARRSDRPAEAP